MKTKKYQKLCNILHIYLAEKNICNLIINKTKKPLTFDRQISQYLYKYIKDSGTRKLIINKTKKLEIPTNIHLPVNFWFNQNSSFITKCCFGLLGYQNKYYNE